MRGRFIGLILTMEYLILNNILKSFNWSWALSRSLTFSAIAESQIFYQDGAPPQFQELNNYLNVQLNEQWIGKQKFILWPARSPDLSLLDFYFWRSIDIPTTHYPKEILEKASQNGFATIPTLWNAINAVKKHCCFWIDHKGAQFEHHTIR